MGRSSRFHLRSVNEGTTDTEQLDIDDVGGALDPNGGQVLSVKDIQRSKDRLCLLVSDPSDCVDPAHLGSLPPNAATSTRHAV